MKIGFWEIVVVLIVALIVIGPDKLPAYMRSLGKGMNTLRKAASEMTSELQEDVVKPLNEAQKPLKDALAPVTETAAELNAGLTDVRRTLQGKPALHQPAKAEWICPACGAKNTGRFCSECGRAKNLDQNAKEAIEESRETAVSIEKA
jgi:sec-independent protein translocase protein TatB